MEFYTSTLISSVATPWGTRPETAVTGMSALDVLNHTDITLIGKKRVLVGNVVVGGPQLVVRDFQGNEVTASDIVGRSRAMATTPAAQQAWVSGMARAVVRVLHASVLGDNQVRSDDWRRAGVWLARTVFTPLSPEITDAVRAALPPSVTGVEEGLSRMVEAASAAHTSRATGTALRGEQSPTSRLRGTPITDSRNPGRRP